ncbi:MAG: hypothetical protein U0640_13855 [Phycisphaerales bacterium]
MTKSIRIAAVLLTLTGAATTLLAQPQDGQRQGQRQRGGQGRGDGGGFGGFGGMRGMMQGGGRGEQLRKQDIERAADMLQLTDEQRTAAMTLADGYDQQLKTLREEQQAAREEARNAMRDGDGPPNMDAMREAQQKQREKQASMETQLLSDMKALLTPAQSEKWASVESTIRRGQKLRTGMMAGERLNVADVVHDLNLPADQIKDAEGILEQYNTEIDRELAARETLMDKPMPDFRAMRESGDFSEMQKLMSERREASTKVREVNKRFARQVEATLPESARAAFTEKVQAATYPEVFRKTSGAEAIAKAIAMPDVTPEQMEKIAAVEENYKSKMSGWTSKATKAWDELETQFKPENFGQGGGGNDAMRAAGEELNTLRRDRRDLDRATLKQLKEILTADQAKELPDLEEEDGGGRNNRRPRDI